MFHLTGEGELTRVFASLVSPSDLTTAYVAVFRERVQRRRLLSLFAACSPLWLASKQIGSILAWCPLKLCCQHLVLSNLIATTLLVCCRVVLSQLSGRGRGDIGAYNTEHYSLLMTMLEEKPMKDGDEWLSAMMRKDKMLGVPCQFSSLRASFDAWQHMLGHNCPMCHVLCSNAHHGCQSCILC